MNVFDLKNPVSSYFKLSIPVVISMIITLIYNLADTFFIASTNNADLVAGVSLCAPLFTILMAFGNIFGQGGNSLVSRYLGENKTDAVKKISSFCFSFSIIIGLVITGVCFLFSGNILHVFGANGDVLGYAVQYYSVIVLGSALIIFSFVPSNLIRSEGLANESMIGTVLGAVINIILDPIFISYFGLGAAGAALATVLGYITTDIYFFYILKRKTKLIVWDFKNITIEKSEFFQILSIGFSTALANLTQSICVIMINTNLVSYGSDYVAAMGIVLKIIMIVQLLLTGFAFGGAPLYGYLYGGNYTKQFFSLIRFIFIWMVILAAGLSLPLIIWAKPIIDLFIQQKSIIEIGSQMLVWQCLPTAFAGIVLFLTVLFQSCGKAVPSYLLALSRQGIIFAAVVIIMKFFFGYNGIIQAQFYADLISFVLAVLLYLHTMKQYKKAVLALS